jgi:hypothetical protein
VAAGPAGVRHGVLGVIGLAGGCVMKYGALHCRTAVGMQIGMVLRRSPDAQ